MASELLDHTPTVLLLKQARQWIHLKNSVTLLYTDAFSLRLSQVEYSIILSLFERGTMSTIITQLRHHENRQCADSQCP